MSDTETTKPTGTVDKFDRDDVGQLKPKPGCRCYHCQLLGLFHEVRENMGDEEALTYLAARGLQLVGRGICQGLISHEPPTEPH